MNPDLHPPPPFPPFTIGRITPAHGDGSAAPPPWPVMQPPPGMAPRGFTPFPGAATPPPTPWTAEDERKLKTMRDELDTLQARRNVAGDKLRIALAHATGHQAHSDRLAELSEQLAHHADAIRDALAPFDSGVRQANG